MKPEAAFNRRVMRMFEDMLDQPEESRADWLDSICADDPAIRQAVRAMIDAGRSAHLLPTAPPEAPAAAMDENRPGRIGQYRVIDELGRGGMGIVYLGERDDGLFEHKVAIKLIRRTLLSERARERFATERRILARLRHPHIAHMHDGGITADGDPYIVMEAVQGEPITDYCTRRRLDLKARLALFGEAADAIDHAHRNLIVHADIKPGNVVVEDRFGVKLLDFGVARLLSEAEAGAERGIGYTPGYASPARVAGLPPTPADDIYAIGLLLQALLADVPGHDGDLSAIVAKATEDDPERRYGTVRELVDDLDRWQSHRPTSVTPPGRLRRTYLLWRRHRLALTLGGVIATGLIVGIAIISLLYLQSDRRRILADRRFSETRRIANYVIGDVDPELARLPGSLQLRRQMVLEMGRYLAVLEADRAASGDLKLDIAAGYLRLAHIYGLDPSGGIGDIDQARKSLAHAKALLAVAATQHPDANKLLLVRAEAKVVEGAAVFVSADVPSVKDGLAALLAAEAMLHDYLAAVPGDTGARLRLWRAQIMSARAYSYLDRPDAGRQALEQGLGNARLPVRSEAERDARDYLRNASYLMLAEAYQWTEPRRAIGLYDQLVDHVAAMQAGGRSDWQNDFLQASALSGRAALLVKLGERQRAARDYQTSIDIRRRLLMESDNHEIAAAQGYVQYLLADLKSQVGDFTSARALSDQAIAWSRQDSSKAPGAAGRVRLLAMMLADRAYIERHALHRATACTFDRDASLTWQRVERAGGALPLDSRPDGPLAELKHGLATDCTR